ncbi:hypothetical protein Hypma_006341 [Hypsizygus marmoreus]|uniref:Uncharacterized protein n=1 Tax=Hypsizygus marmoreus TaxID=39966 RepID=A0A369JXH7_HYPMA|nr:hypothetical protein Hypma_006341 [Hypsizygus marmoreus]
MPSRLPNPWLQMPRSVVQPELVVILRYFRSNNPDQQSYSDHYPYELPRPDDDKKHFKVFFFEHLGRGPPPHDISANPGDLYIDQDRRVVYVGGKDLSWQQWNGCQNAAPGPPRTLVNVVAHPILKKRYLWKSGPRGHPCLGWITRDALQRLKIGPNRPEDPVPMLYEIYGTSRSASDTDTSNRKRRRGDEEDSPCPERPRTAHSPSSTASVKRKRPAAIYSASLTEVQLHDNFDFDRFGTGVSADEGSEYIQSDDGNDSDRGQSPDAQSEGHRPLADHASGSACMAAKREEPEETDEWDEKLESSTLIPRSEFSFFQELNEARRNAECEARNFQRERDSDRFRREELSRLDAEQRLTDFEKNSYELKNEKTARLVAEEEVARLHKRITKLRGAVKAIQSTLSNDPHD